MAVRLEKPWIDLNASNVAKVAGHLGVYDLANIRGMLERNICVAVGTDGSASNNRLDILNELKDKKVIGKHGIEVGKKLGYMLSGGATTPSKILTEQNLYDLEREIFIDLISQKPTQERIRHTLDTGKPLFN